MVCLAVRPALLAIVLAATSSAVAAQPIFGAGDRVACSPARTAVARYQEQVCFMERAGYTACRWIDREHVVRMPGTCVAAADDVIRFRRF